MYSSSQFSDVGAVIIPMLETRTTGCRKWIVLPRVTQLVSGIVRTEIQAAQFQMYTLTSSCSAENNPGALLSRIFWQSAHLSNLIQVKIQNMKKSWEKLAYGVER